MQLYFSPLACSLATRIALYEAEVPADFVEIDPKTKRTPDGTDFRTIYPLGLVPAIRTDAGDLLTENGAILQYVADRRPAAELAPRDGDARSRLHQWLSYIGTELHKAVFIALLDPHAPDGAKQYALSKADARLGHVAAHLTGREYLLDRLTVADAYLFTILNWTAVVPVKLDRYPALAAYMARLHQRPAFRRAFAEERELYARELARHAAAAPAAAAKT